ncbi:hypothetical protein AKJ39_00330 [candidate division MSBL1 archaeon SCGC-AAA259J03]|uniref:Uncharacterized protein n=1 Tax=candidate division MSBL1 archaeon SCGC-AAA259J03 TaxID=1698269 RepID=A0A656YXG8_9EURY|nr:hypothetical protein AKJ39_00330 [candidate division MSBL1 archaeon SCGC-AAA259J03]
MVFERLTGAMMKLGFRVFEPVFPVLATYFLNRRMRKWEERDLIQTFKVKVGRTEKYHYTIDLDVFLTEDQARDRIRSILNRPPIGEGR